MKLANMIAFVEALEAYQTHRKYSIGHEYRDEKAAMRLVEAYQRARLSMTDAFGCLTPLRCVEDEPAAVGAALSVASAIPQASGRVTVHLERARTALMVDIADALHDWAFPKVEPTAEEEPETIATAEGGHS